MKAGPASEGACFTLAVVNQLPVFGLPVADVAWIDFPSAQVSAGVEWDEAFRRFRDLIGAGIRSVLGTAQEQDLMATRLM